MSLGRQLDVLPKQNPTKGLAKHMPEVTKRDIIC